MPALLLLGFEMDCGPRHDRVGAGRPAGHSHDDSAAAGLHRQAARHLEVSGRDGLCRGADGRRKRGARRRAWCSSASASRWCTSFSRPPASCGARPRPKNFTTTDTDKGLKGAEVGGELSPELLGVGFLIGPRIASPDAGGGHHVVLRAGADDRDLWRRPDGRRFAGDEGTHQDMDPGDLKEKYLRYIGAGAVAAGGIISMCRALPLIYQFHRFRCARSAGHRHGGPKHAHAPSATCRWLSSSSAASAWSLAMMFIPSLGLGCHGWRFPRRHDDPGIWLSVCHGLVALDRRDRLIVQPHLRHDDRHAAADMRHFLRHWANRTRSHADGADRGGRRVHRVLQRRHDLAGPQDRLS